MCESCDHLKRIGCKVMGTLASVEIEIMLILRLPCCLSSSNVQCLESVSEIVAGTDTKYEPFEDLVETETPKSPRIIAQLTYLVEESEGSSMSGVRSTSSVSTVPLSPDHPLTYTTPAFVPILRRTACMVMRVLLAMLPGLSVGRAEVEAMSDSVFRKRVKSSYDSSPSPTLPVRKRYREKEGPTAEDDDPAARDKCWDQKSSRSYCCLVSAAEGLQLLKSFYCQMDKDVCFGFIQYNKALTSQERSIKKGINKWYQSHLEALVKKNYLFVQDLFKKMEAQPEITQNISLLKLLMFKTRDYDLWSMRMEQYLIHTDYALWEVIINGDSPVPEPPAVGTVVPPKTKAQKLARKNELKAKSTLLLAIPDEHLLTFHAIKDAKSFWEAIKIRFGGNKELKKMHKIILKQQYKNFVASRSEGLDKTYDRFQKLISQLELNETLSMDDLYNNLKVYEAEIKGQSSLGSNSHNVAIVSSENTSNINETVNVAHDIPTVGSEKQPSASSYADDIGTDDLEEMDLKWKVAMIKIRVKKFIKKLGRKLNFNGKEPVGFDNTKVECYNCHRRRHFARECHAPRNKGNMSADNKRRVIPVETPASALVVQDGLGGYDWSCQAEEGPTDFSLMAHSSDSANSSNSEQKEILNRANLEILGYQYGLESLKDRIHVHQKNETIFEESIAFLKYNVQVRDISIKDLRNELEETMKEKDDLKEKLTNFKESSKNLTKLINSQMSANDKTGLGYDNQLSENEIPKCKIFETASDSSVSEIDEDNNQAKD
nr:ribonuclease H-like domain-containing protein [Tanacetum cinerariifolium]